MKKLTLTLCAMALASLAYAGTESYSGKDMKQTETPCPTWYGDNEFTLGISGVVAPSADGDNDDLIGDIGWGGAIDLKYFFRRYFGIGVQGFGLATDHDDNNNFFNNDDDDDFVGGALATFTFRYPIPCSHWAPYGWVGVGGVWGGDNNNNNFFNNDDDDDGRFMSQYGIGIEYRFTRRIGWTNDVSFNWVDGHGNDFFQIRSGINFAF